MHQLDVIVIAALAVLLAVSFGVIDALQALVGEIKQTCVTETEIC